MRRVTGFLCWEYSDGYGRLSHRVMGVLVSLPALPALCTSDTAAACYCECLEQLEPETIELLAAMTDVVQL